MPSHSNLTWFFIFFEGMLAIPTVVLVQHMPTSRLIPPLRESFSFLSLFKKILCMTVYLLFAPMERTDVRLDSRIFCWQFSCCEQNKWDCVLLLFSRRVFILGPSHHVHLSCCALSPAEIYRTPLYDLRIDQKGIHYFPKKELQITFLHRYRYRLCWPEFQHA